MLMGAYLKEPSQARKEIDELKEELLNSRATIQKLQEEIGGVREQEARLRDARIQTLTDDMSSQRATFEQKVSKWYSLR